MKKNSVHRMVEGAMIAAIYAALTYAASLVGLAYGNIQFRFSEALTILPVFTPAAIPGLAVGCFLGNLGSPYGIVDIVCGTLATFLASILTRKLRKIKIKNVPWLAPLPPVIMNALIVGAEIAIFMPKGFSWVGFLISALQVGAGELVICYGLGIPLYLILQKGGTAKKIFNDNN